MLLSLEWLQEYIELTAEEKDRLPDTLTQLGHEVEAVRRRAPLDGKLLVGEVLSARQHPDAEKLRVCTVAHLPGAEPLEIVCGAHNARGGIKVALAVHGSELPDGTKIKRSKLRGVESMGMLCSGRELGLSDDHDGILEFPLEWPTGAALREHLKIDDVVYDLKITPNRADCVSYIGIARDLAAKLGKKLRLPSSEVVNRASFSSKDFVSVSIGDSLGCDRFLAWVIRDVPVLKTPFWMKKRLEAAGQKSIHFLVDVSNYVMLEWGQPNHIYDLDTLPSPRLEVGTVKSSQAFATLDQKQVTLEPEDILIQSQETPVGIAGIMGGLASAVSDATHHVVLEVARFHPKLIRRTAKRLRLSTDASFRFERGVDVENLETVAQRVAHLIAACAKEQGLESPQIASNFVEAASYVAKEKRIALRLSRIRELSGLPLLSMEACIQHLESLGLSLLDKTDERMLFSIPSWRHDMDREVDLIEEVLRLKGFDKIPSFLPKMDLTPMAQDPFVPFQSRCKIALAELGACEIITFPFCKEESFSQLQLTPTHPLWPSIRLKNPINELCGWMQSTQLPNMIQSLLYNRNHGVHDAQLFQVGKIYFDPSQPRDTVEGVTLNRGKPNRCLTAKAQGEPFRMGERHMISFVCDRIASSLSWHEPEALHSYFSVKQLLESFFGIFTKEVAVYRPIKTQELPFLHPHAAAIVSIGGVDIGWLGELHPSVVASLGLEPHIVAFELDLETLFEQISSQKETRKDLGKKFPPIVRDISFLVEKLVSYASMAPIIESHPRRKHLQSFSIFDTFEGESLPPGKKSVAFSLTFRSSTKTLTDDVVEKELESLRNWLVEKLQVEFR